MCAITDHRQQHFVCPQLHIEPDFERSLGQLGRIGNVGDLERREAISALAPNPAPPNPNRRDPRRGQRSGEMIVGIEAA